LTSVARLTRLANSCASAPLIESVATAMTIMLSNTAAIIISIMLKPAA
jgi:hypothetical protein